MFSEETPLSSRSSGDDPLSFSPARRTSTVRLILAMLADSVAINLAFIFTFYVRYLGDIPVHNFRAYASVSPVVTILGVLTFYFMNLYDFRRRTTYFDVLYGSTKAVLVLTLILTAYSRAVEAFALPRLVIGLSIIPDLILAAGWRIALLIILKKKLGPPRTLIVGCGPEGQQIKNDMALYSRNEYEVVGFLDDSHPAENVLGKLSDLRKVVQKYSVDLVILTTADIKIERVLDMLWLLDDLDVDTAILPNLYEIVIGRVELKQIAGIPLLEVDFGSHDRWYLFAKRFIDLTVSTVALAFGIFFLPFIAAAIKIDSPGPVFYSQERLGQYGRRFRLLKFRSMIADAEKMTGPVLATENDERVTWLGRLLRQYHIDELPQLWNVFRGDMSLVGPRPEREVFARQYVRRYPAYKKRLLVKPGITGLAQVYGRYDTSVEHKIRYDLVYIKNMSLLLDFKILLLTLYIHLFPQKKTGIHEDPA